MARKRILDQEPDTIALVPEFVDFMVVGTYSLINGSSTDDTARRRGSLQILRISQSMKSSVQLGREDFEFGIYDIHFHPQHKNVLGVATSAGTVLIFHLQSSLDDEDRLTQMKLSRLGTVVVENSDTIITQIRFIELEDVDISEPSKHSLKPTLFATATTQSGNTTLMRFTISCNNTHMSDATVDNDSIQIRIIHTQSYDLEAWTALPIFSKAAHMNLLILSGGDDSQLLISRLELDDGSPSPEQVAKFIETSLGDLVCTQVSSDKRTHSAGIVAFCPLDWRLFNIDGLAQNSHIFLTGSYDEHMRLYLFEAPSASDGRYRLKVLSELKMPGGVWRIHVLDSYAREKGFEHLLLIAGHTSGSFIVRLTCTPPVHGFTEMSESWHYDWKIEKHFTEHQSLVYAVAARMKIGQRGMWEVISTSFYDKLLCEWEWEDEVWSSLHSTAQERRNHQVS